MVEEVVLTDRAHVGDDALADRAVELLQRHPLPLRGRLHHLRAQSRLDAEAAGESDRGAGTVAIEIVVHAALLGDDQRHFDAEEVELAAEAVFDEALDCGNGLLSLLAVEQRGVMIRQDLGDLLIGADAGAGEIGLLVVRGRHRECCHRQGSSGGFVVAAGRKPASENSGSKGH